MVEAFGEMSNNFVVVGSCALALYASDGSALSATKDIDCISLLDLVHQLRFLGKLSETDGPLSPDPTMGCRYEIKKAGVFVDVMDLDGATVGGTNRWFKEAVRHARRYQVDESVSVSAITPPYFLLTKLVAAQDLTRNDWILASRDVGDVVALVADVHDVASQVVDARLGAHVANELAATLAAYRSSSADIPEIVQAHLEPDDAAINRASATLVALLDGAA